MNRHSVIFHICNVGKENFFRYRGDSVKTEISQKNVLRAQLLGCAIGALLSYNIESKYINYETKAKFSTQILKIVIGIVLVLALKTGLKYGLLILFGESLICDSVENVKADVCKMN